MKGKGKLICKVGNVALFMEDHGGGEVFKLCVLQPGTTEVAAGVWLEVADAVFLSKCLDSCLTTIMQHNVEENWYGDEE